MSSKSRKDEQKRRRKKNGEERVDALTLHPETKQGLFTLFLLVLAILFTLSAFKAAGGLGAYLDAFSRNLLGLLSPLLPVFLFFIVIGRFRNKTLGIDAAVRLGAGLFILMLGALIHLIVSRPNVVFGKNLHEGGGYLGMLISYLLEQGTGFWGAVVILSAGILASLLLLFKTSLQRIILPHRFVLGLLKKPSPESGVIGGAPDKLSAVSRRADFSLRRQNDRRRD